MSVPESPLPYEVHPASPRWGIYEHGADEPVLILGSRQAAEDLARVMNWGAQDRERHVSFP